MFVEIKRGGVTMYTNNQLEVIHLQDSYTIMYALLAREIMNAKSTTKTSYEFTNLKEGQILYVKIRAGVSGYYGKESEVLLVALQPGEVTKITATKNVKTKITLAWEPVSGATGYQIYYRKSTSKESILAGNTIETTFDVTGLSAGKDYYFTIVAYAGYYGADTDLVRSWYIVDMPPTCEWHPTS